MLKLLDILIVMYDADVNVNLIVKNVIQTKFEIK